MTRLPPDYDPRIRVEPKNKGSSIQYLFFYLPDGTRLNQSTGTSSKMLARQIAKEKEKKLLDGQFADHELKILGAAYGSPELTVVQAIRRYRRLTKGFKTPKTRKDERPELVRIFFTYFIRERGAHYLREITTAMVNDYLQSEVAHLSPVTRNRYRQAIKKVFNALKKEKTFRGENPVDDAVKIPLTKKAAQRKVWILQEHYERLLTVAGKGRTSLPIHDMLELDWEIALRIDEMLTLEWSQIDFEKRLLSIECKPNFPTKFGIGWAPKWKQERKIPLTDKAIEILRRQPRRLTAGAVGKSGQLLPTNLVFPKRANWHGEVRYLRCNCISTAWRTLQRKSGLTQFGYHWHDLRRSWNRRAAERGIPVAYRAAFLGHREDVNEGNYETEMAVEFMRERMGNSMATGASDSSGAVRVLFELPKNAEAQSA